MFVVNQAFAHRYLEGRNPLGVRILMNVLTATPNAVPVVGVVSDAKDLGIDAATEPVVYTVVMADGTTWRSQTLAQLEALWE